MTRNNKPSSEKEKASFVTPIVNGVHLAGYVNEDILQKLERGGFGLVEMFSFEPVENYLLIRERFPDMKFGVRAWTEWGTVPEPEEWAPAIQQYLCSLVRAGIHPEYVKLGNEPNLEWHDADPAEVNYWFSRCYDIIKNRYEVAHVPVCFPALSPDPSSLWTWRQACDRALNKSDALLIHVYFQSREMLDNDYEGHAAYWWAGQFPGKPIHITECGMSGGHSREERAELYPVFMESLLGVPNLRSIAWFILDSQDPTWHDQGFTFNDAMLDAVSGVYRNE